MYERAYRDESPDLVTCFTIMLILGYVLLNVSWVLFPWKLCQILRDILDCMIVYAWVQAFLAHLYHELWEIAKGN